MKKKFSARFCFSAPQNGFAAAVRRLSARRGTHAASAAGNMKAKRMVEGRINLRASKNEAPGTAMCPGSAVFYGSAD